MQEINTALSTVPIGVATFSLWQTVFLPASLLYCALVLDFIIGDPKTKWHPVCLMGNFAYKIEAHLRKGPNGFKMFLLGMCAWAVAVLPFCFGALFLVYLAGFLGGVYAEYVVCALLIAVCIAPKSLAEHAKNILHPLEQHDLPTARQELSMIVGRDVDRFDQYAIGRACVESVAENLVDGVLSGLFWAGIGLFCFGYAEAAALTVLHRATNVLDAQWGKKNETYIRFGTFSARFDDVLNFIPARLSLLCISLASLFLPDNILLLNAEHENLTKTQKDSDTKTDLKHTIPTKNSRDLKEYLLKTLHGAWKYRNHHASPNSAWSEASFASALNLELGGALSYAGQTVDRPNIGEGSRFVTTEDIKTSIKLMWFSTLLWIISFSMAFILANLIFNFFERGNF